MQAPESVWACSYPYFCCPLGGPWSWPEVWLCAERRRIHRQSTCPVTVEGKLCAEPGHRLCASFSCDVRHLKRGSDRAQSSRPLRTGSVLMCRVGLALIWTLRKEYTCLCDPGDKNRHPTDVHRNIRVHIGQATSMGFTVPRLLLFLWHMMPCSMSYFSMSLKRRGAGECDSVAECLPAMCEPWVSVLGKKKEKWAMTCWTHFTVCRFLRLEWVGGRRTCRALFLRWGTPCPPPGDIFVTVEMLCSARLSAGAAGPMWVPSMGAVAGFHVFLQLFCGFCVGGHRLGYCPASSPTWSPPLPTRQHLQVDLSTEATSSALMHVGVLESQDEGFCRDRVN